MKQGFLLAAVIFFASCSHPKPVFESKSDTVDVVVRTSKNGAIGLLRGAYSTINTFIPVDTNSTQGKFIIDTIWQVEVLIDTARGKDHKPLFDSLHRPMPQYKWQVANKKFVQIITVPTN
jgi:hypothetical protein